MGYVPPYIPEQLVQYGNRVNFGRWRYVIPVNPAPKPSAKENLKQQKFRNPRKAEGKSFPDVLADVSGKGKTVNRTV